MSWLYCGHMKMWVGENGSLVRWLVICGIYMYMTTVSIAVRAAGLVEVSCVHVAQEYFYHFNH